MVVGGLESAAQGLDIYSHFGDIDNSPQVIAQDTLTVGTLFGARFGPQAGVGVAAGIVISFAAADLLSGAFSTAAIYLNSH